MPTFYNTIDHGTYEKAYNQHIHFICHNEKTRLQEHVKHKYRYTQSDFKRKYFLVSYKSSLIGICKELFSV